MATWVIGDLQGCFEPLQRLLRAIAYEPANDRLWLVGDLVNRGPDSLSVLRWAKALGERAVVVLGNHDLHLLARAKGVGPVGKRDTLEAVLQAPDRDELIDWLGRRPLAWHEHGHLLVHAGLPPGWSVSDAMARTAEVEAALRGPDQLDFLSRLHHRRPLRWREDLRGPERLQCITALLTRMRACSADGEAALDYTGPPGDCPAGTGPWFSHVSAQRETVVLFGHWAALGAGRGPGWVALDSGCVWGAALTAMRLADGAIISVPAQPKAARRGGD